MIKNEFIIREKFNTKLLIPLLPPTVSTRKYKYFYIHKIRIKIILLQVLLMSQKY